jgi:hypothetical protein
MSAKYLRENIADESVNGFSVDLGTIYNTNYKNIKIGMSLRNFGSEFQYNCYNDNPSEIAPNVPKSGSPAKLPMNFSLGIAGDLKREDADYWILAAQLDNCVDREETWNIGTEYKTGILFLRGGYQINYDAASYSLGFGVLVTTRASIFNIDYAYTDMGRLQENFFTGGHRLSLKMSY